MMTMMTGDFYSYGEEAFFYHQNQANNAAYFDGGYYNHQQYSACQYEQQSSCMVEQPQPQTQQQQQRTYSSCRYASSMPLNLSGAIPAHQPSQLVYEPQQFNFSVSSPVAADPLVVVDESLQTCPHCPYTTRSALKLEQHVTRLHTFRPNALSKTYKCSECDYTTMKPVEMRNHLRLHQKAAAAASQQAAAAEANNNSGNKTNNAFRRRATCPLCSYSSTTAHVRQHTRRYHRQQQLISTSVY